jgi:hypothetical protein
VSYTTTEQVNAAGVFALFSHAIAQKLKYPKIRLIADYQGQSFGTDVVLARAGDKSHYTGQIMVTDGRPFGSNLYFGRIDEQGVFHATDAAHGCIFDLLRRLSENPAKVASEYGKLTGNCCFCSRRLDDPRSTAVGYGPVCAEKFGVAWGE